MGKRDKKYDSESEKKISHVNVLWLIYRALSENIEIQKDIINPK